MCMLTFRERRMGVERKAREESRKEAQGERAEIPQLASRWR